MNTKFNIGDKVSYVSGVGGAETVFEILQIRISEDCIIYSDYNKNDVFERELTLYTEPKKKFTKYLWAYESINTGRTLLSGFLIDEADFKTVYEAKNLKFFKRLDFSATEFEAKS